MSFLAIAARTTSAEPAATNDYSAVDLLFNKHCLDCHAATEPEAELVMETFELLMKGGESGAVIVPGKSDESRLVKMIEGKIEKDGKKKIMPPGKREKLKPKEIALIRAWIDAGAKAPAVTKPRELVVPKIDPRVPPRKPVTALAYAAGRKLLAIARANEVELRSAESRALLRTLTGHRGNVNALAISPDEKYLFAAAGETGLFGEVRQWDLAGGGLVHDFEGHKDALYSIAVAPDGKTLATGSYDQKIKLWNAETGKEIKTLSGHNGAVFGLAFRPDGKILASASADRTVKLWDVAAGERRDTLSQPLKEQFTVAFSPDGKRLFAGGADNRIRAWQISETAAETTNPILRSRFAHEGAILRLAFSPDGKTLASAADDRTVKLWDADELNERLALEKQPDWPPAVAFVLDNKAVVVGRLDGTVQFYDVSTGMVMATPKPELTRPEPRGIQRGKEVRVKLIGTNLAGVTEVKSHHPRLSVQLDPEAELKPNQLSIKIVTPNDIPRNGYELSVITAGGESGRVKLLVDDLPQICLTGASRAYEAGELPASFWGTHEQSGDSDQIQFDAKAGQTLVFDAAARSIGSKADPVLTLLDATGKVLASNNSFDASADPLLAYTFATGGRYTLRVSELLLGASPEHFYRLTAGALPYVTGFFPLSVVASAETGVELFGYNLPEDHTLKIKTEEPGELDLPLDPERFRSRRTFKVMVVEGVELVEAEPNDTPEQAMKIRVPCAVGGRISETTDVDLFRFDAKAGQTWIIETAAARHGSPVDTRIEVLQENGPPVERLLLQAVRNTAINFRGIDSNATGARLDNYEEMELNEYVYFKGEVVKLFRMPQGPDSEMLFYTSNGKRRGYFDTSSMTHALDEPAYIVEPHPPGTKLTATGLPVFPLYYANDDDGERRLGTDSRLFFTAPSDGAYLIRVTDTRGYSGDRFVYRLAVREPKPDFKVTLNGVDPVVNAGSGREFSVTAERIDGFDGEIRVDIASLPPGFSASTPLVIQAGHTEAKGTINSAFDLAQPADMNALTSKVIATATIQGQWVNKDVNNFGKITPGEKPKLFVAFEPGARDSAGVSASGNSSGPLEITMAPGQIVPATLKIRRNGYDELVTFTVENLPHGIIVDNIGLNGVLIPKGENEREIFLAAAKWVPETDRLCYAVENQAGKQTSLPLLIRVRKPGSPIAGAGR